MLNKFRLLIFVFLLCINCVIAQETPNQVISVAWKNNALVVSTTGKITYAEARLKDPDRLIVDLLNCNLQHKLLENKFISEFDENISVSQLTPGQVRLMFVGIASINRKIYITNNERTLIIRIARVDTENGEKIVEKPEETSLLRQPPGNIREITIEEEDNETNILISATKSIKYDTYSLKNPDRFAIDLLNINPPEQPLPKFNSTSHVTGIRVGRAASSIDATRVVIDLASEDVTCSVDPTLLGGKLKVKLRFNKSDNKKSKKSGIKVVIDPGHGGYDIGASYGGFEEKNINVIISEKLKKNLEKSGISVFLTRDDDSFLSLAERVEITNSIRPDVFISIHANAIKTTRTIRGAETYFWTPQSQKLAYYVHNSILSNVKIPDHFIRKAKFYVIRHTPSPAVLAELGFLSNYDDRKLLTSPTVQDLYAKALTEAILKFLDIDKK